MMALALGLVGQPVQPYLTTGATDFVNSVQKGKEDAIKLKQADTVNQKSALDLLTAQKKAVKEEEVNSTMPELMGRIAKGELTDKQKSDLLQVHPDFAKTYIATNDEKAKEKVNNAIASVLLGIAHSTDKAKTASDGIEALKHFGINLNLRGDETPEQIQDALTVSVNGMKALDATGSSVDASGRVVKTNKLGQVTDIGAAPKEKAQKAVPVMVNGVPKTVKVPGTNDVKILNTDGTLSPGGSMPVHKAEERPSNYFPNDGLTGDEFLATLPKSEQSRILAIATARAKLPSYQAMRRDPTVARLVEGLYKAFPDYDETQFAIRQGAGKAFAYGKQGDKLRSFGTAVQHIETLLDIAKGLSTGDMKRVNMVANLFGKETGSAPPVTMEAVQQLVADEILASIVPGAGGVEERLQLAKKLSGNNSYDVLKQVTERFQEMMKAQAGNLKRQAEYGGVDTSKMPDYTKHSADEGKKPTGNQVKQPQTPYEWYVLHWNDAQKKGDKVRMQKLTEEARRMGIAK